jgi:hypothetical protein
LAPDFSNTQKSIHHNDIGAVIRPTGGFMSNKENIDVHIQQLDKIIPPLKELKTLKGESIKLPTITLGLELKIMRQFLEFMKAGGYQDSDFANQNLYNILLNAFCDDKGNKVILDIFATITGKPVDWLLENVDLPSLAGILLPFFVTRIQALTKAMEGLGTTPRDMVN